MSQIKVLADLKSGDNLLLFHKWGLLALLSHDSMFMAVFWYGLHSLSIP